MRLQLMVVSLLVSAVGLPAPVHAWDVAPCSTEHRAAWQKFEASMKAATDPNAPDYVPHPFPATADEAWQDFLFYHRRAFQATPSDQLEPTERRFFDLIDGGRAKIVSRRVVNWSQSRCEPGQERAFYFLFSVIDPDTGVEITRVAVNQSGLVHSLIHRPIDPKLQHLPRPIQDLDHVSQASAAALGAHPTGAQYVATTGTLRCDVLVPCVAFREGGEAYLKHETLGLFRIAVDRGALPMQKGPTRSFFRSAAKDLSAKGELLVSGNFDKWLAAVPVKP